ncbi:MAG TPA: hypothetical protein VHA78_04740 [Candidatus Peribacteraceae bacterium]|nr:hypothetical protein [Candidatus Peribacteraceae bacterium]
MEDALTGAAEVMLLQKAGANIDSIQKQTQCYASQLLGGRPAPVSSVLQLKEYIAYLGQMADSHSPVPERAIHSIIDEVRALLEKPENELFLHFLMDDYPLTGMVALHIATESKRPDSRLTRDVEGWYRQAIESAEQASMYADLFFSGWIHKVETRCRSEIKKLALDFIKDLHSDVRTFLAGCVHMGTAMACHAQREDCAVYMTNTPFRVRKHEEKALEQRLMNIKQMDCYADERFSDIMKGARIESPFLYVPTFVSVVDIRDFLLHFTSYMRQMHEGLQDNKMRTFARPEATKQKQARLVLDPPNSRQGDFRLRIDKEERQLAVDFGGIDASKALDNAEWLGDRSDGKEIIMSYSQLSAHNGELSRVEDPREQFPRGAAKQAYVSVMQNPNLTPEQRCAIVSSTVLRAFNGISKHPMTHFSYHLRGTVSKPEYHAQFPNIIAAVRM